MVLEVVVVVQEFARHVSVGGTGGLRSRRRRNRPADVPLYKRYT